MRNKALYFLYLKPMSKSILVLLSFFLSSCNQQPTYIKEGENSQVTIKKLKSKNTFCYQIGENSDSFGYDVFEETGEINSVVSIKIVNKYIYLSDAVHGNVKRLDLESGELIASEKLDTDSSWINSLAYYNDLLYVFTFKGNVYLLDKNLKKKDKFFLNNYIGNINVFSEDEDGLKIYRHSPNDIFQNKSQEYYLKRIVVSKTNNYTFDTIPLNNEEYLTLLRKEIGKEVLVDNKLIFKTTNWKYEIPDSLSKNNDYDCRSIDYSKDYIVTFEVNPRLLKLIVYKY